MVVAIREIAVVLALLLARSSAERTEHMENGAAVFESLQKHFEQSDTRPPPYDPTRTLGQQLFATHGKFKAPINLDSHEAVDHVRQCSPLAKAKHARCKCEDLMAGNFEYETVDMECLEHCALQRRAAFDHMAREFKKWADEGDSYAEF
eukprot:TRINITY_DN24691_c0_g1_i2.p2 TRINITY_DN24691_c0_g1~~TRINITY_DN24691_c0_g1_i2.p2  ORF type:complete len:149 (+),score=31.15 TRINITY_DN24691_c0_g1_i2:163-609(+)